MGVNTVRIYGWNTTLPYEAHSLFLDTAHAYGLRLIVTYYLGTASEKPLRTAQQREDLIAGTLLR